MPDLFEHQLHLAGGVGDPAGPAGGQQYLLLLQLEQEQFEQLTKPPQVGGQLGEDVGRILFRLGFSLIVVKGKERFDLAP